jgi:ABC-type dipeptide/oligopeptide/nickel transport system ATPase subunit
MIKEADMIINFLIAAVLAGAPLVLATVGEIITAIIFVGEDLDVLMALSDRIMVMADHRIAGITDARTVTKDYLGSLMTDAKGQVI